MAERFGIAQDGTPTQGQLANQRLVADAIKNAAGAITLTTATSRAQSLALTKLEEALMWAGKAIFQSE